VTKFATINYTLSLSTDPLTGPYTTFVNKTLGNATVTIRLYQWTAGPKSSVSISFGDMSANQTFILMGSSYTSLTYSYTTAGTFLVVAYISTGLSGVNITVNTITVVVNGNVFKLRFYFSLIDCAKRVMFLNFGFEKNFRKQIL
jgi:hypothetical protein